MFKLNSFGKAAAIFTSLSMAVSLAGCSSSNSNDDETKQENSETRIVETDKGEVEIPANPQRIVSDYYLGEFFSG